MTINITITQLLHCIDTAGMFMTHTGLYTVSQKKHVTLFI